MDDLIKLFMSLPDIKLSDHEWAAVSDVLDSQENRSQADIIARLDQKKDHFVNELKLPNLVSTNVKLMTFLNAYATITAQFCKWLIYVGELWFLINNKQLPADLILPLTMELLPNDIAILKLLQVKVELATKISDSTGYGYALITLYSAVASKINEVNLQDKYPPIPEIERTAPRVKVELANSVIVKKLNKSCEDYRKELCDFIFERIKIECKERLTKFLADTNSTEATVNKADVIECLFTESVEDNKKCSPELTFYLHKHMSLYELHLTLKRKQTFPSHTLEEFHAKFELHSPVLVKNLDIHGHSYAKPPSFFSSNRLYDWVGWKSKEEIFLEMAKTEIPQIADATLKAEAAATPTLSNSS
jgi:hypothetical protein